MNDRRRLSWRGGGLVRWIGLCAIVTVLAVAASHGLAQTAPPAAPAAPAAAASGGGEGGTVTLRGLFMQSADMFTVLLVGGSLIGWAVIIICFIEVREKVIAPHEQAEIIGRLCKEGRWVDLRAFVAGDDAFVSKVMRAALDAPGDDLNSVREAAELAASEESARWFRKIEPLNVIGNLGPLLGLSGTVWGMIIAFAALGQSGGQANPATLSTGIAKALFHTLLGLLLAVPCLTVFGFYRSLVDRLCTRAMVTAATLIEFLPADSRVRRGLAGAGSNGAQQAVGAR